TCAPCTQQNSEPGTTARESCVMAATSVLAGSPRTSSTSTPPSSWSSSKEGPYRFGVGDGLSVVGVLAAAAGGEGTVGAGWPGLGVTGAAVGPPASRSAAAAAAESCGTATVVATEGGGTLNRRSP